MKIETFKRDIEHDCPICGKKFKDLNYAKSKTCSLKCGAALGAQKRPRSIPKECPVCGGPISVRAHKTCSQSCGAILRCQTYGNNRWKKKIKTESEIKTNGEN